MNCLKKQLIYSVLICNLFFGNALQAQSVADVYDMAVELQNQKQFNSAIKYFQRVSYFGNGYNVTACLLHTADCYYELNDLIRANEFYEMAYFSSGNDSLRNLIALSRAAIFIYDKKYLESLQEIFSTTDDESIIETRNIYLATCYFGLNKFEESKSLLVEFVNDSVSKTQLIKLIDKATRIQKRNPKTAKILSMIIPGLGQFYAGDIKNGINSFLITSAFMYLTINTTIHYSIFEAAAVLPWYSRYYIGGFNRAQTITENNVEARQAKIFAQIMKLLEKQQ